MSFVGFVKSYWWRAAFSCLEWRLASQPPRIDFDSNQWQASLRDPTAFYFEYDYDVVLKDWQACSSALRPGGVIVLDEAALTTAFAPLAYVASRGYPGPSRVASELDHSQFREILQVGHNRAFQKIAR